MATTDFAPLETTTLGFRIRHFTAATFVAVVRTLRAVKNRRSVGTLLAWDDRMLKDIGLTPSDVRAVMALPLSEDPSRRLGVLSVERRAAQRAMARESLKRRGKILEV